MFSRKNTHRPVAPGSAHLPVRVADDREETTGTGAPELMAVGVKTGTGEPPRSGQWELLTTTNATKRGTHENRNEHHAVVYRGRLGANPKKRHNRAQLLARPERSTGTTRHGAVWGAAVCGAGSGVGVHRDWPTLAPVHGARHATERRTVSITCAWSDRESIDIDWLSFISRPLRYVFSSWLRRLIGGLGQIGPVLVPVIWTQLLPGDRALCSQLNCQASSSWNRAFTHLPLVHSGWGNF
jgi:hypothetical protein